MSTSVLDPATMRRLRESLRGNTALLKEVVDAFFGEVPMLLVGIRRALEKGDAAGVRMAAHSLKADSAQFGAMALAELCRELEAMGKAGTLDGAAEKLAQAEAAYEPVKAALEELF